MRVRVLHAKLYAYALPGSTARQLFISSTLLDSLTARQLLDRPRQTSTDLDKTRRTGTWSQPRQARQGSTRLDRQGLDNRLDSASTARQLDSQGSRRRSAALKPSTPIGRTEWREKESNPTAAKSSNPTAAKSAVGTPSATATAGATDTVPNAARTGARCCRGCAARRMGIRIGTGARGWRARRSSAPVHG